MEKIIKKNQWKTADDLVTFHFYNQTFDNHFHDYYEIILILNGEGIHTVNGVPYSAQANDVWLLLPQKQSHALASDTGISHLNVALTQEAMLMFCNSISQTFLKELQETDLPIRIKLSTASTDKILSMIYKYQALNHSELTKKNGILNCVALSVLEDIFISYDNPSNAIPAWLNEFLRKISTVAFMSKKPSEVYCETNYSYSNFEKLFKKYIGMPFVSYFNLLKLNYAKELLKTTDMSILDISNSLGISSLSHFCHIFKKANNISPSKYREKYNK